MNTLERMSTLNISLPDSLQSFVDDQDRQQLRGLLLAGANSPPDAPADAAYFDRLRKRVKKAA